MNWSAARIDGLAFYLLTSILSREWNEKWTGHPGFYLFKQRIKRNLGQILYMHSLTLLIITGFLIGIFGTLIGAGGGFILVPMLILSYPELSPETITAISIVIVAANAISGSIAYARSGRIDFKAGLLFAIFTIPGSVLGVLTTQFIQRQLFNILFGILLIALSVYLLLRHNRDCKTCIGRTGSKTMETAYTYGRIRFILSLHL